MLPSAVEHALTELTQQACPKAVLTGIAAVPKQVATYAAAAAALEGPAPRICETVSATRRTNKRVGKTDRRELATCRAANTATAHPARSLIEHERCARAGLQLRPLGHNVSREQPAGARHLLRPAAA